VYTRRKLNDEQLRQYVTCAGEMQAEGAGLYIPNEWIEPSPVKVTRAGGNGQVCVNHGVMCYVIPVQVVAYSRVNICGYELYSELEGVDIQMPYVRQTEGRFRWGSLQFALAEVLNDRFETGFRLKFSGDMVEGVLIGHGGEVPKLYGTTRTVTAQVTLIDSLGRRSAETAIELPVAKRAIRQKAARSRYSISEECAGSEAAASPIVPSLIYEPEVDSSNRE
jgi:hypothetical protein